MTMVGLLFQRALQPWGDVLEACLLVGGERSVDFMLCTLSAASKADFHAMFDSRHTFCREIRALHALAHS